jgi:sulfite exporter TauE/SafE
VEALLLGMLATGFASGLHCAGMCGGFVSAFSAARMVRLRTARKREIPDWACQLVLSAGRIASYTMAGAFAGALGGAIAQALPVQAALFLLANAMLVLTGLYIAGAGRGFGRLEAIGAPVWKMLQPAAARLFGARRLPSIFAAGMLWGFLPCGLVYGALAVAALTGNPVLGAATMLAFGLGTLPNLLAIGVAAARLRGWMTSRAARLAAGALILGFGAYGMARAATVGDTVRHGWFCL